MDLKNGSVHWILISILFHAPETDVQFLLVMKFCANEFQIWIGQV